jgi:hypothetical protein
MKNALTFIIVFPVFAARRGGLTLRAAAAIC